MPAAAVLPPPVCPPGVYPSISGYATVGISRTRPLYQFPFGPYGNLSISVPIAMEVYRGASCADKSAYLDGSFPETAWVPCYYRSFVKDADQEEFFNDLIAEFRRLRAENNLDSDQYLELMTAFVQSIPYGTEQGAPKFPIETFADYSGDCDDKALLLAALLAREGYNTSLLYFAAEKHMGVGVADPVNQFRSSGYAYIETTGTFLVGMVPERIQGGKELRSVPLIIAIDSGRSYGSGMQVQTVLSAYYTSRERILGRLPALNNDRELLNTLITTGEILSSYESTFGKDAGYAQFREDVLTLQTIASHLDDRTGAYRWLISR
ncbi:MAG: hypothetical protein LUQ13_03035 [Methanomicrobiales archaeon]|nr:hypothetical protein [Methanomicrobiales archaeon]